MKIVRYTVVFAMVVAVGIGSGVAQAHSESLDYDLSEYRKKSVDKESPEMAGESSTTSEYAYLGGGCFWCVEAVYERIEGVKSAVSGYAGGQTRNPTYREVSSGRTGHAEVVRVEFDPGTINYEEILEIFWKSHDPTTLNRQGYDVGTQYRSIILYNDEQQREKAERSKAEVQKSFSDPIVTEIETLDGFYEAEDYHQDYFAKNPTAGYCQVVIAPKLEKLGLEGETY